MTLIESRDEPVLTPRPRPTITERLAAFGRPPRIMGLDIARGLAILGMAAAHLSAPQDFHVLDPATWGAIVHGRSSVLFAVLAGISIALMTGRSSRPEPADLPRLRLQLVGRGSVIFLLGLGLELLGTPIAVILTFYGLLYVVALPLLRWTPGRLLILAAGITLAGPLLLNSITTLLPYSGGGGVALVIQGVYKAPVWIALMCVGMALGQLNLASAKTALKILVAGIACTVFGYGIGAIPAVQEMGTSSSSYGSDPGSYGGDSGWLPTYQSPQDLDFSGMLCEGEPGAYLNCIPEEEAALYSASNSSLSDVGSAGSLPLDKSADYTEPMDDISGWADYGTGPILPALGSAVQRGLVSSAPHTGGSLEIIGSGGFAMVVMGLCLLAARPLRWPLLPFAALGTMPLTAYCVHVVSYFLVTGPGGMAAPAYLGLATAAVFLLGSTAWAIFLGQGPLERLTAKAARAMSTS
ncbi:heparan-alpha-glucosaminide N-acetyltransferase domain-containing protein [Glutamicibacter sp. NPDC087344]|uniref:heparan-alpha-glucosaminide N-acetyltransferase domain-containing protein n=1 Tax=Glutamicibacter sp. NPDC087344 TaxID=3363994 RepID=UPI003815DF05